MTIIVAIDSEQKFCYHVNVLLRQQRPHHNKPLAPLAFFAPLRLCVNVFSKLEEPMTNTLSLQRTIAASPADVYRAITRATHLRAWLCDAAQSAARPNGRVYFAWNNGYAASGRYTSLIPDQEAAFTWQGHGTPTPGLVTFKLTPENGRTIVHLELSQLGEGASTEELQRDWETSLENLQSIVETGDDLRFTRRPMLGVFIGEFSPEIAAKLGVPVQEGIRLDGTAEGLGAHAAGLRQDDVIVSMAGKPVIDYPGLAGVLQAFRAGDEVEVQFYRGGEQQSTMMKLSARHLPAVPATAQELAEAVAQVYAQSDQTLDNIVAEISEEEASQRPAESEWSVKEVLAHLIASEREAHTYISDMIVEAERWTDEFENTTNIQPRLQAILTVYPTLAELVAEVKRNEKETVAMVANLPAELTARRSIFVRIGRNLLAADGGGHVPTHFEQIRAAIAAVRA
jgi:uncharacterized protein YndB with AHSA1/START domain